MDCAALDGFTGLVEKEDGLRTGCQVGGFVRGALAHDVEIMVFYLCLLGMHRLKISGDAMDAPSCCSVVVVRDAMTLRAYR